MGVTGLFITPSLAVWLDPRSVPSLRWLVLGGEVAPRALIWRWLRGGRVVVEVHGREECGGAAICAVWRPGDKVKEHNGTPLPGAHVSAARKLALQSTRTLNPAFPSRLPPPSSRSQLQF